MIRHFNYTKRKRIPRDHVSVSVKPGPDVPTFDANINLAGLDLPADAKVYVEAHYKSSLQRFEFGTVASVSAPADRSLDEVDRGNAILFRVKVVDVREAIGRIVAEIDDVSSADGAGGELGRYCILPVNFIELREQLWRLSLDGSRPVLEVNRFPGAEAFVKSDPIFTALVYPEAVRQVLRTILLGSDWEGMEGLSGWQEMWVRFARSLVPTDPPEADGDDDERARTEWIEDAVGAFCEKFKLKTRVLEARAQERT